MLLRFTLRALLLMAFVLIGSSAAVAERKEIQFGIPGGQLSTLERHLAFAHNGSVGFTVVYIQAPTSTQLVPSFFVSFSVAEGKAVDRIDLSEDFGFGDTLSSVPVVSFKVHDATGLVLIYGNDRANEQKTVALVSDEKGRLTRLWVRSFGPSSLHRFAWPDVAFDENGSRGYLVHYGPSTSVTLLRTEDGIQLSEATLPGPPAQGFIYFDNTGGRVVALSGFAAYTFTRNGDDLVIESRTELVPETGLAPDGQGTSSDGRFLVGYTGYMHVTNKVGFNSYVTYDLDSRTARESLVPDRMFPISNALTFHPATGALFAPLTGRLIINNDAEPQGDKSSRQVDIMGLSADGTISRTVQFELPERSPGNPRKNILFESKIEVSASGALGFVAATSGQLFTFDAATGEIVGDERADPDTVLSMRLLENLGVLVFSKGTDTLTIIDVTTGPAVQKVKVAKKKTTIKGVNFLSGARVKVNGRDLGLADRNPDDPGHEIILQLGKNDFPRGESFTVEVVNRDGLTSKPFSFTR